MSEIDEPQTERELLLDISKDLKGLLTCQKDHEDRIRSLEHNFWKIIGISSMISFLAGMFGGKLGGSS